MPKIEIVSLRFNLDKEDDNRLFALLQKRADVGKRNEFLKQLLCDALTAGVAGDRPKARQSKKPPREPFEPIADQPAQQPAQEAQEPAQTSAPGPESGPRTAAHGQTNGPDPGGASSTAEPDREAASLVGSFVQ